MNLGDLVYGIADIGAGDDLRRIYNEVDNSLQKGTSFGLPVYSTSHMQKSEESQWVHDQLRRAEAERLYQLAKRILCANRGFFEALADAIETNDYLISSDIQAIKKRYPIQTVML